MEALKKWYIVYTKTGYEQKVCDLLTKKKFECFLPVNHVVRNGNYKYKIASQPLFERYVFVYMDTSNTSVVKQTNGVLNFVYWHSSPAVIGEEEIYTLRRFLNTYERVTLEKLGIEKNGVVNIAFENEKDDHAAERHIVKLRLPSLGYTVKATDKITNVTVISAGRSRVLPDIFYAGAR